MTCRLERKRLAVPVGPEGFQHSRIEQPIGPDIGIMSRSNRVVALTRHHRPVSTSGICAHEIAIGIKARATSCNPLDYGTSSTRLFGCGRAWLGDSKANIGRHRAEGHMQIRAFVARRGCHHGAPDAPVVAEGTGFGAGGGGATVGLGAGGATVGLGAVGVVVVFFGVVVVVLVVLVVVVLVVVAALLVVLVPPPVDVPPVEPDEDDVDPVVAAAALGSATGIVPPDSACA